MTLPTPFTSHVSFENVYEPSEDSYLVLDTLSSSTETEYLRSRFNAPSAVGQSACPLIVELGTGSGVVIAFVAAHAHAIFGRSDVLTLGTDVNSFACSAAAETITSNVDHQAKFGDTRGVARTGALGTTIADLASAVRPYEIDVLIFNPPYVPSEDVPSTMSLAAVPEKDKFLNDLRLLALATDGGEDGMETTNRLLAQLPMLLNKERGIAYILLCAQNKPEDVKQRIREWGEGWDIETVGSSGKKAGWEKLQIIRIARNKFDP